MQSIDLVIMAGGEGRRLEPFTKIVPKPLLYVEGESLLLRTIKYFRSQGIGEKVYLLTCYKTDLIQSYLDHAKIENVEIIVEKEPLGTIGGISFIEDRLSHPFVVSNCDIVLKVEIKDFLNNFIESKKDWASMGFNKSVAVPYGIFEFDDTGLITNLIEKPTIKLFANAGVYFMTHRVFDYIRYGQKVNIDELFFNMMNSGDGMQVYPIDETAFYDIGEFKYYKRVLEELC